MQISRLSLLCQKLINLTLILGAVSIIAACTNLSGEPDILRTLPPPTPAPELNDVGFPESPPDLGVGASIFAANCTACHGVGGAGDGELVQAGQVMNPGNFTDPAQMADQTPLDYFSIITNGNLAQLMPPWSSLSETDRWAVTMLTYTLHYSSDLLDNGAQIVEDNEIVTLISEAYGDPEDPQTLLAISENALIDTIIASGLSEEDSRAAAAHIRSLSLDSTRALTTPLAQIQPTAQPIQAAEDEPTGTITGVVTNGTAGGTVPANLSVSLRIFEQNNPTPPETFTEIDANNAFQFEDVPIRQNVIYVVSGEYAGIPFITTSQSFTGDTLNMPLQIFEVTDDPNVITINALQTQLRNLPDSRTLEVIQEYQFSNTSDRVFRTDRDLPDGRQASLTFSLPPAAVVLDQNQSFYFDQDTFEYIDTRAVPPGQGYSSIFAYFLPFEADAIIEHDVLYPAHPDTGIALLTFNPSEIELVSDNFTEIPREAQGAEPITPDENLITYAATLADLNGLLSFELRTDPVPIGTSSDRTIVTSDNFIPALGVGLLVVVIFVGIFVVLARRQEANFNDRDKAINTLVDQLSELERQHNLGEINHDVYQRQKADLQARLEQLKQSPNQPIGGEVT